MLRWVNEHGLPGDDQQLRDLCAAFQRRVVDTLIWKALEAAEAEGIRTLVLAGGVAANRELRERSAEQAGKRGIRVVVPPFKACTDNASMIAYAGLSRLTRGENDAHLIETNPHTSLPQSTKKGRGKRPADAPAGTNAK
jgi:N6-L-threonylcarbamoyladenine synthase